MNEITDESTTPMEMSCEMSPERFGVRMADAAYEAMKAENERLRAVLAEILNEHHWVDAHPGEPCKRLLNAVRVSTWERWRAALYGRSGDV